MRTRWIKLLRGFSTILAALIATIAAIVGILSYLAPQSYPVVNGPVLYACPDQMDAEEKNKIKQFIEALLLHKSHIVYVKDLLVGISDCALFGNPTSNRKRSRLIKAIGPAGSKTLTLIYYSLDGEYSETYHLVIHLALEDYPFATSNCDENCVGANGLYQIKIGSGEGNVFMDLAKAPIVDSVARSYECAINQFNSKNWWQRFWACKF